jgi:cysteamine dioxygenase
MKPWNQDYYVNSVARLLRTLPSSDPAFRRAMTAGLKKTYVTPDFTELIKTLDVQISLITFEKGESLPHHNHPAMTGVLTCVTGSLLVSSYDLLSTRERAPSAGVLLHSVKSEIILPGRISTLTQSRGNIHTVKALDFTQVIDIFTPPYSDERIAKTTWYTLERDPGLHTSGVFIAHPYEAK